MNKFVIGVDADGVLVNMSDFYLREGRKFFKKEPINPDAYDSIEMYGISSKQNFLFGLKVYNKYCKKELPMPNAQCVINKLNKEGNELHEITARKFASYTNIFGKIYRKMFEKWCKKHNMHFKSFEYCSEDNSPRDKLIACSKLCVDVMIEDKPDVALYLAENGIKVLLFTAPYNKNLEHENIIRVNDWQEVYSNIQKIKANFKANSEFKKLDIEEKKQLNNEEKIEYFKSYHHYLKNLEINEKAILKGEKRFKLIYKIAYLPIKIKLNPKVIRKENVPYQNGFIVASNHLNSKDQYIIGYALGNRPIIGFVASTIKDTFRGNLFKLTNSAVFIDRNDSDSKKDAEEELSKRIAHGSTALIFPEGTRKDKDEQGRKKIILEFKKGTVAIAQKTGAPILPVAISYQKNKSIVNIGEIMYVKPNDDIDDANQRLKNSIVNLIKKNMQIENNDKVKKL